MTNSKQPEALRLADRLESDQQGVDLGAEGMGWGPSEAARTQAATELRRLYEEVEFLSSENIRLQNLVKDLSDWNDKLKERLSYREAYPDNFLKEPEQEPVAWYRDEDGIRIYYESKAWDDATPLYTSPPARKPLTHEQRVDLLAKFEPYKHEWHAPAILIDMVEAAHGITGENT